MNQKTRKNPRTVSWDYASSGFYFVTFCTFERACLLGAVEPDDDAGALVRLSQIGECCQQAIAQASKTYPNAVIGPCIIMPNHVHIVIKLMPDERQTDLGSIVGFIKSKATAQAHGLMPGLRLWQRGYHDHIIRNEQDYARICEYVGNNPLKWELDRYYAAQ